MRDIAIYGAGGFGREIYCLLQAINKVDPTWNVIGFFDDGKTIGESNEYGVILGGISELNNWNKPLNVVMGIGTPSILAKIVSKIENVNVTFPNIVAPDVRIYDEANMSLGKGNLIGFRGLISCNVHLADFNLLNNDVHLGHDSKIGSFNVFNPSVRISGEVSIGEQNFFGVCSIVLQQKKIGNNTTIGANSTILRNTKDNQVYIGTPATILKY